MTPVLPIDTSGAATQRSHDRRQTGWRRAPVFQVPGDHPPADDIPVSTAAPAQSVAMLTMSAGGPDAQPGDQASQTFVDNVMRLMRNPQRITGWFVDLSV